MSRRLAIACGAVMVAAAIISGATYVILLPRVITGALERRLTNCAAPQPACAPPGTFLHKRSLASPADRLVVNPNADTVYSSAWLDLRNGPWALHVPDMGDRYFSFQFLDAWTDVFGYVSRRTGEARGGDYLIVGPGWSGAAPDGMKIFRAGTNDVWVLARTLVDGESDLAVVTKLQDQFGLKKFVGR